MLQTLNSSSSNAKTAQIMARYRPIAPRPHSADHDPHGSSSGMGSGSGSGSVTGGMVRHSPYLRNMWARLQSRPTRTRKRGRTSLGPTPNTTAFKRTRSTLLQGLITPPPTPPPIFNLSFPMPHHMQLPPVNQIQNQTRIPEEKDLLAQLQKPPTPTPLHLIPSTVSIQAIKLYEESHTIKANNNTSSSSSSTSSSDIEKELELQPLPGFVSDSKSQVRLVNTAYTQMVGQPECAWAQSLLACDAVSGNVTLNFKDLEDHAVRATATASGGFSCWARIEWPGKKKNHLVNAFGEAISLASQSNRYKFAWRFHI